MLVVGYGTVTVVSSPGDSAGDASSAGGAASSAGATGEGAIRERGANGPASGGEGAAALPQPLAPLAELRSATLARDVRLALVDMGGFDVAPGRDDGASAAAPNTGVPETGAPGCVAPSLSPGERLILVRYDGRLASLVVSRPVDGRVSAGVLSCEDGDLLDRVVTHVP